FLHISGRNTVQILFHCKGKHPLEQSREFFIELKYWILVFAFMCEMIDDIEIEHLRMALARARKEMHEEQVEEEPRIAIAN
ncbi:hypothetical protein, partial [Candidatus Nitrosotalea sp. TS]|uniref:hypothetical protein n=1 Tax=Candidatus Nitrosotalea sp. TS TaxID=2341020 RepID=UPI001C497E6A